MGIQWFLLFVAYSSLAMHAFLDISRGPLFPEILKTTGFATAQGAYFFSATSFCMFVASFSSKYVLRSFPVGLALLFYLFLLGVGQYLLFSADTLSLFILSGAVMGLGFGGMGVCQNIIVGESAPAKYHRKLYGGLHSMYAMAALFAPLCVGYFLSQGVYWRDFVLYSLMLPVLAMLVYLLGFKKINIKQSQSAKPSVSKIPLKMKLLSSTSLSFYVTAELIVSIWLVIFLQREKNFSVSLAGNALSIFFVFLLMGRVFISIFSLKISNYKLLHGAFLGASVLLLLGLLFSPWFLALSGLFMSVCFPSYMSYMAETFKENLREIMPYCIGGMSFFVMLAHAIAGFLADEMGLYASMSLAFVSMLFASLSLWYLRKTLSKLEIS